MSSWFLHFLITLILLAFQSPRPAAVSIATVVNWTSNLVVGLAFPSMQSSLEAYSFVPFAVLVAIFIVVLWSRVQKSCL
jgi:lipoprotein signal peptidase